MILWAIYSFNYCINLLTRTFSLFIIFFLHICKNNLFKLYLVLLVLFKISDIIFFVNLCRYIYDRRCLNIKRVCIPITHMRITAGFVIYKNMPYFRLIVRRKSVSMFIFAWNRGYLKCCFYKIVNTLSRFRSNFFKKCLPIFSVSLRIFHRPCFLL